MEDQIDTRVVMESLSLEFFKAGAGDGPTRRGRLEQSPPEFLSAGM